MILASHSRISIPPETWYLKELVTSLPLRRPLERVELELAVTIMTSHYRWPDLNFDSDEFRQTVMELPEATLRDVVDLVYQKFLQRENKRRWGDKTPSYIKIVDNLVELYPEAKFIHILRDGRDVAKSFQLVGWYGRWLHKNTQEWTEAVALAERWRNSVFGSRIYLVCYEDLVLDMEKTVRGICAFLSEDYEPQMLFWQQKVELLVPEREKRIHGKLNRPSEESDVARWQREMTPGEILIAEALMGRDLRRLGYPLRYGAGWAPLLIATKLFCRTVLPASLFIARVIKYAAKQVYIVPSVAGASNKCISCREKTHG
jgi:hypothetical protein